MLVFIFVSHNSVDGGWTLWGSWSAYESCSTTCGQGARRYVRKRQCSNPTPKHGGLSCNGSSSEYINQQCSTSVKCRSKVSLAFPLLTNVTTCWFRTMIFYLWNMIKLVNGGWSAWTSWYETSTCSKTCGSGLKSYLRWRHCTNPFPKNGGRTCNGGSVVHSLKKCLLQTRPGKKKSPFNN